MSKKALYNEGARVANVAADILQALPSHGNVPLEDEDAWEAWKEAVDAVRRLSGVLYGRGRK